MAFNLQHAPDRFCIEAFRGAGKSWLLVAFVLWTLFLNPQAKVLVISASQSHADAFSTFTKQLINGMPLLAHLAPRVGQRDSNIAFDVGPANEALSPSVKSVGITGQLTGSRANLIVADDIETPKNSQTFLLRDRLAELVKEMDAVLSPGGRVVYLGTPQVEASLYNRLADRGYTLRIWPAEIPKDPTVYRGRLAPYITKLIESGAKAGDPVEPSRFPREELDARRAVYGLSGYALQFMLDTSLSDIDKHPLKLKDLIVMDTDLELGHAKVVWGSDRDQVIQDLQAGGFEGDKFHRPVFTSPEMTKYTGTVMAIDPSGRGKDETSYAIVKYLFGTQYLMDVGGFRDGYSEDTLKSLALAAHRCGVNYVIPEDNFGGGMFRELLRPHLAKLKAGSVDDEWKGWSTGQKELRILDTLEPLVQSHRLVVNRRIIEDDLKIQTETPHYSFVHQFTRISRTRGALQNDDRVEAVAMACAYWTERMNRDVDKAHDQHKRALLDTELKKFLKHCGSPTKGLHFQESRHQH